jgi:hypothetical protein
MYPIRSAGRCYRALQTDETRRTELKQGVEAVQIRNARATAIAATIMSAATINRASYVSVLVTQVYADVVDPLRGGLRPESLLGDSGSERSIFGSVLALG